MSKQDHPLQLLDAKAEALNHAREFVEMVSREAPGEYRELLGSRRFDALLNDRGRFNHGQLYAYAEFRVFEREFRHRFPEASGTACINAFSELLLKNDISISNLLSLLEAIETD